MDYIVGLENAKPLRRWGELRHLHYRKERNANPVILWLDKWRGTDYKSQKKLVDDPYSDAIDADDKNKVGIVE